MNKMKEALKDNLYLLIILIVLIVALIGISIYRKVEGKKPYDGGNISDIGMPSLELNDYEVNEYKVITKDYKDIVNMYYKDYISILVDDPERAFQLLTDTEKEAHFNSNYVEFLQTRDFLVNKYTKNNTVKGYRVSEFANTRTITVIDSASKMYIFEENGIWNYRVRIIGDTTETIIPHEETTIESSDE